MGIDVLLVDDEELVRVGLRVLIEANDDLRVVGEATDGSEVVAAVKATRPHVVLLDVRMVVMDGIQATAELRRAFVSPPRVLILTSFGQDTYVHAALRAGAHGLLHKRASADEIAHAIRLAAAGTSRVIPDTYLPADGQPDNAPGRNLAAVAALTAREREVLSLIAQGLSNTEIAAKLVLGRQTVKTHVSNVLAKLQVRDRTQAAIAAYEAGLTPKR
ncbi:response regulator [Micromonospora zamorensis]|uniref:response regulator n=1 Tax=Micromonospora zamorensis TaxID=709883 RepID=UPI003D8C6824